MAEPDGVPPTGEEIHLPDPTLVPLVVAVGVTLVVTGLTIHLGITALGLLITGATVIRWIRDVRRDVEELPLDH